LRGEQKQEKADFTYCAERSNGHQGRLFQAH
jgi:hypothetical protein